MISRKPKISIVTTCYQAMPYIGECVESVQAQDWPDVEHIIQDADSDDGTKEYLGSLTAPNIVWCSEADDGPSQGLNRAFSKVTGDILLTLNADDALLPHACTWAAKQFETHEEAAAIYGDEHIIDMHGLPVTDYVAPDFDLERLLCVEIVPPAQATFIRCDKLREAGFHVDTGIRDCCDFDLLIRLAALFPVIHVKEFVTRYRWHTNKSRRPEEVRRQVNEKQYLLDRFFDQPGNRKKYFHLRERSRAGLMLWASESCFLMNDWDSARRYIREALNHEPDPAFFFKYFLKTLDVRPDFLELLDYAPEPILDGAPPWIKNKLGGTMPRTPDGRPGAGEP